jgi:cytochrome c-type biogenesis protein CcmH
MVCQNQSIDDSDAPLARDLRILIRERLQAGDTDNQALDFLTARYGDFVLLRPRFAPRTALLWLTPIVILAVGAFAVVLHFRRPGREEAALSAAEQERLTDILGES